jgi:PPK2 family polyphosphate:nucleotide phosphotransferase
VADITLPMNLSKFAKPFRVTDGKSFHLQAIDPADTLGIESSESAKELLERGLEPLRDLQHQLYAQERWALLVVLQAMDAAGKDSVINHVMSGVNPQGCEVSAFKTPSAEELNHDFLWRTNHRLPERGRIGIFNRSYYEEVLVVRVHREMLDAQKLPASLVTKQIWKERFKDLNAFERYLARNGTVVLKFFLHLSKEEQKRRFLKRLDVPERNWKFSAADVRERKYWNDYMDAYQDMIRHTATEYAPWYVVPADHKWFTRIVVAAAIVDALESLNLSFPKVDAARRAEIKAARAALLHERHK